MSFKQEVIPQVDSIINSKDRFYSVGMLDIYLYGDNYMVDILLQYGTVLTMDEQNRIISDGSVAINNGRIVEVGKTDDLKGKYKADLIIDCKKRAILPGFVNTHSHLYQSLMKGGADHESLEDWAMNQLMPIAYVRYQRFLKGNFEGEYYATLKACLESIRFGGTTILGMDGMNPKICEAFHEIGIRGIHAFQMADQWVPMEVLRPREEQVRDVKAIYKKWHNADDGRIKTLLGPSTPYICSRDYLLEIMDLAKQLNIPLQTHVAEAPYEVDLIKKEFKLTPLKYLESIGFLNLKVIAVHCIWLTEEEKDLLKKYNVSVSHNPESNMKLGSGVMDLPGMQKRNINVALATDGAASNDNLNMLSAIRATSLMHRVVLQDPTVVSSRKLLRMATINGAQALGMEQKIGSIEPGKKADIIVVDLSSPHTQPLTKIENILVHCALGSDVETVIIDGKIVMQNREIFTVDEKHIIKNAVRVTEEYWEEAKEYQPKSE